MVGERHGAGHRSNAARRRVVGLTKRSSVLWLDASYKNASRPTDTGAREKLDLPPLLPLGGSESKRRD
ncbi:hypothetical protein GUJ93_ZPchr0003g16992 [Zizania palustris]|uniref:Uncharacterized protein n=1 Tax=Zizania palustris TaxID=103762 RepID=A0A8J5VEF0_ZIZPA|nr:hypothetical protein GUJ93_ZPchr0003g16992 [Zizania palustris]